MSIEALRNVLHRELHRFIDRRTRRVPCFVDSYNGQTHTVKVKLQPEGTLSGWMQIETAQVGLLIAPNIGDPGWIEFHENDRRAGVFVASNHNNNKPPPKTIEAGEFYYQNGKGQWIYVKSDGSIESADGAGASVKMVSGTVTTTDKASSTLTMDGEGNVTAQNSAGSALSLKQSGAAELSDAAGSNLTLNGSGTATLAATTIALDGAVTINGSINVV